MQWILQVVLQEVQGDRKKPLWINSLSAIDSMQKVINVLALASFAVSAAVVGAGAYVFVNREAIKDNIKSKVTEGVAGAIQDQLGDLGGLGGLGGGSSPVPSGGGSIPGVSLPF